MRPHETPLGWLASAEWRPTWETEQALRLETDLQ